MPEGDTIFRAAERLRPVVVGKPIRSLRFVSVRMPELFRAGTHVREIETRGKHLLVHFASRWVLHTHMKMDGAWRVFPTGTRALPFAPRRVRVRLEVDDAIVVCVDAPVVRLLRDKELARDPMLAAVGADLLDADFDAEDAAARFRALPERTVAEALLDQRGVAGIGNVFRSEILHRLRWSPDRDPATLSDEEVARLIGLSRQLLQENVAAQSPSVRHRGARITRERVVPGESPVAVYGRAGRGCHTCGETIEARMIGAPPRVLYFCPRCQRRGDRDHEAG